MCRYLTHENNEKLYKHTKDGMVEIDEISVAEFLRLNRWDYRQSAMQKLVRPVSKRDLLELLREFEFKSLYHNKMSYVHNMEESGYVIFITNFGHVKVCTKHVKRNMKDLVNVDGAVYQVMCTFK